MGTDWSLGVPATAGPCAMGVGVVVCVGSRDGGREGTGVSVGTEGGWAVGTEGDALGSGFDGVGVVCAGGEMVGPDHS